MFTNFLSIIEVTLFSLLMMTMLVMSIEFVVLTIKDIRSKKETEIDESYDI